MSTDPVNSAVRDSFIKNRAIAVTQNKITEILIPIKLGKSTNGGLILVAETVNGAVKPVDTREIEAILVTDMLVPSHIQETEAYQQSKTIVHETLSPLKYSLLPPTQQELADERIEKEASVQFTPVTVAQNISEFSQMPLNYGKENYSVKGTIWASGLAAIIFTAINFIPGIFN